MTTQNKQTITNKTIIHKTNNKNKVGSEYVFIEGKYKEIHKWIKGGNKK